MLSECDGIETMEISASLIGGRHYIGSHPASAIPYLVIAGIATLVGSTGNLLVLFSICVYVPLRKSDSIFLVNLALCDLMVTSLADPFGIIGKS